MGVVVVRVDAFFFFFFFTSSPPPPLLFLLLLFSSSSFCNWVPLRPKWRFHQWFHLLECRALKGFIWKSGVGHNIVLHASPAARNVVSVFRVNSTSFCPVFHAQSDGCHSNWPMETGLRLFCVLRPNVVRKAVHADGVLIVTDCNRFLMMYDFRCCCCWARTVFICQTFVPLLSFYFIWKVVWFSALPCVTCTGFSALNIH